MKKRMTTQNRQKSNAEKSSLMFTGMHIYKLCVLKTVEKSVENPIKLLHFVI